MQSWGQDPRAPPLAYAPGRGGLVLTSFLCHFLLFSNALSASAKDHKLQSVLLHFNQYLRSEQTPALNISIKLSKIDR